MKRSDVSSHINQGLSFLSVCSAFLSESFSVNEAAQTVGAPKRARAVNPFF